MKIYVAVTRAVSTIRPVRVAVATYTKLRNIRRYLIYYLLLITSATLHVKIFCYSSAINAVAIDIAAIITTVIGVLSACGSGSIRGFGSIHSFGSISGSGGIDGFCGVHSFGSVPSSSLLTLISMIRRVK